MSLKQKLDSILDKWTLPGTTGLSKICAGVVTKDGTIIYEGAAGVIGFSAPENKTSLDYTFKFLSTSKAITIVAVVQLIEKGKIGPDDLVEDYVPEVKGVKLLEGLEDYDSPILYGPIYKGVVNKPTIRNLMTHTAGFSYPFLSTKYAEDLEKNGLSYAIYKTRKDVPGPYVFEPGTKWHYGTNIDVLGKVVENVTGEKLEQYFKKNIFEPCGTSFMLHKLSEKERNVSVVNNNNGTLTMICDDFPSLVELFNCGGHGIIGEVGDYLKFISIFLNKGTSPITGKQVLKPESVEKYSFVKLAPEGATFGDGLEIFIPETAVLSPIVTFFIVPPQIISLPRPPGTFIWCQLPNLYYWIDPIVGVAGMFATPLLPLYDQFSWDANDEFKTAVYEYLKE